MKILVADDDRNLCRYLEVLLTADAHDVISAFDGIDALKILQSENAPRLAILDRIMPGMNGVDIIRTVRDSIKGDYIYIILLTAMNQREDIIAGLNAGADDYISKPFDPEELKVRLRAGTRIITLHEELALKALCDSLTGLWNHSEIMRILERELSRAERDNTAVGVIMSDIDHFKNINDTYGHLAGDKVIIETCQRMKKLLRPYDHVGRYGGEEFLVVVPACDKPGILGMAERFCEAMRSEGIVASEAMLRITISCGVALSKPGIKVIDLVNHADSALYEAKNSGRDCLRLFQSEIA
jgi:diguanylate cyclase (GGDEF)-like protein